MSEPQQRPALDTDDFDMEVDFNSRSFECDIDVGQHEPGDLSYEFDSGQPAPTLASAEDEPIPLSELWDVELDRHIYEISGGRDLFEELKASLLDGDKLFATPLAPLKDEMGTQDDELNFGIELSCQLLV